MVGVVFTVLYFGYIPRISLERANSAENRIDKITELIAESKFGIHDLSRLVSKAPGEIYRMNMPFELGVDYGCKKFKSGRWTDKKILILETERYRYQQALSDLSGCDIKHHNDEVDKAIKAVRNWLITEELKRGDSSDKVWDRFNDFQAYLYDEVVENDGHLSIDDVEVTEIMHHMEEWFKGLRVAK